MCLIAYTEYFTLYTSSFILQTSQIASGCTRDSNHCLLSPALLFSLGIYLILSSPDRVCVKPFLEDVVVDCE